MCPAHTKTRLVGLGKNIRNLSEESNLGPRDEGRTPARMRLSVTAASVIRNVTLSSFPETPHLKKDSDKCHTTSYHTEHVLTTRDFNARLNA